MATLAKELDFVPNVLQVLSRLEFNYFYGHWLLSLFVDCLFDEWVLDLDFFGLCSLDVEKTSVSSRLESLSALHLRKK
jgi:hypothetical protein